MQLDNISKLSDQNAQDVTAIMTKLDDFEDRARRSNLVLFGSQDRERETWAESEASVLQFCSKELNITIDAMDIERAHRLGKYKANKN